MTFHPPSAACAKANGRKTHLSQAEQRRAISQAQQRHAIHASEGLLMKNTHFPRDATHPLTSAVGVRRYVNNEIARVGRGFDASESHKFEFLCECGRLSCRAAVKMTLADYGKRAPGSVIAHA